MLGVLGVSAISKYFGFLETFVLSGVFEPVCGEGPLPQTIQTTGKPDSSVVIFSFIGNQ